MAEDEDLVVCNKCGLAYRRGVLIQEYMDKRLAKGGGYFSGSFEYKCDKCGKLLTIDMD